MRPFSEQLDLPGVAPSRQKRSRETTLALLDAGAAMLRTRSLAELSIEALCAEVGATVGAFYSRFESKDAYFNALMALASRDGERRVADMRAGLPREPPRLWAKLCSRIRGFSGDGYAKSPGAFVDNRGLSWGQSFPV